MMARLLLVLAVAALGAAPLPAAAAPPDCSVPAEILDDDPLLPLVAQHLREKRAITIVAIGGASTAGAAAANPQQDSYPHRLQQELQRRHPGVPISVINKGIARQTTQEMVDRFSRDVYPAAPTLVIWETGTVDAVHGIDVDSFAGSVERGLAALLERHYDVVLVNMQYSRDTVSVINFAPYLDTMAQQADADDVYLFRRFEMMRYWSENGIFQFASVPPGQRQALAATVYDCLARRLADAIEHAAR